MNTLIRAKLEGASDATRGRRAQNDEPEGLGRAVSFAATLPLVWTLALVAVLLGGGVAKAQPSSTVEVVHDEGAAEVWPLQASLRPCIMPEGQWAVDVRWRAVSTDIDRFVRDNFLGLSLFGRWAPLSGLEFSLGVPTTVAPQAIMQGLALAADYRFFGGRDEGLAFVLSAGGFIPVRAEGDGTVELSVGAVYWPAAHLSFRVDVNFVEILGPNRLDMDAPVSVLFAMTEALYGVGRVGLDVEGVGQDNRVYPTAGLGLGVGLESLEGGAARGDIEVGVHLPNLVEDFGLFELRLDWRTYW